MRKQIALIRGINVGRAKRVAMADLRALVEDLGYQNVRTLLNSGNVLFNAADSDELNSVTRIEAGLLSRLGVSAKVIVLTADELAAIVTENPLVKVASDHSRLLVAFFGNPEDRTHIMSLAEQEWGPEALAIGTRAAYLWCPDGVLASRLAKAISNLRGEAVTTRNWATVLKLYAIIENQG